MAVVCPHAAFADPSAPADARPRESVECLSLVLYPKGTEVEEDDEVSETVIQWTQIY